MSAIQDIKRLSPRYEAKFMRMLRRGRLGGGAHTGFWMEPLRYTTKNWGRVFGVASLRKQYKTRLHGMVFK